MYFDFFIGKAFEKLVSVEDAHSAPVRGEDEYPHMPLV